MLRAVGFDRKIELQWLDAVAARLLVNLTQEVPGLLAGSGGPVFLDVDDTVKAVYGADIALLFGELSLNPRDIPKKGALLGWHRLNHKSHLSRSVL